MLAAAGAQPLWTVDLEASILATEEGRAARTRIEGLTERAQDEASARRARLLAREGTLSAEAFERERQELNAWIEASEAKLDRQQAELVDPMVERMEAILIRARSRLGGVILEVEEGRVVGLDSRCDLSSWLADRFEGRNPPAPSAQACRARGYAVVDRAQAVRGTARAQRIVAARDAYREEQRQRLRRLERQPAVGEADRRQEAARVQAEVAAHDDAARAALGRAVDEAVRTLSGHNPGIVWLLVDDLIPPELEPRCDATVWVKIQIDARSPVPPRGCAFAEAKDP